LPLCRLVCFDRLKVNVDDYVVTALTRFGFCNMSPEIDFYWMETKICNNDLGRGIIYSFRPLLGGLSLVVFYVDRLFMGVRCMMMPRSNVYSCLRQWC
jgi:hypothetical protein